MLGSTVQLIGLACHAAARVRGLPVKRFFPDHHACDYCKELIFRLSTDNVVANDPDDWIDGLLRRGPFRVRLSTGSSRSIAFDRETSGYVGGGGEVLLWIIWNGQDADAWRTAWRIRKHRGSEEKRNWHVRYTIAAAEQSAPPAARPAHDVAADMEAALGDIQAFAAATGRGVFAEWFGAAREVLAGRAAPDPRLVPDVLRGPLAPPGVLTNEGERLLSACRAASVFGGMGSWNDHPHEGEEEREFNRVSDRLYALLQEGVCAAVDSQQS